ncbi:farnesol dehydrogenase-like [Ctenocephalides felis]|uniref:farnesol dehydrogenase-like n=1 Tax=Ctenocephalides felis TaxID=7515 RepID=UPI000E6E5386|nr:farnesol dehydrogenase-like [Ctenocephalides felis]
MDRWTGKVAVVTGANSGMGAAISKDLAKLSMQVVGLDLQIQTIQENAHKMSRSNGGVIYPRICDIREEKQVVDSFTWISEKFGGVDVLVNSAGIIRKNMLTNVGNTNDLRDVLKVNVLGLCFCTREAFKSMKERDVSGHIININSMAGHSILSFPGIAPMTNIYAGSKYCLTALSETLRQEIAFLKNKTKVTSISPGLTATNMTRNFSSDKTKNKITDRFPQLLPEDVSNCVKFCLSLPEHVQVNEIMVRAVGENIL